MRIKSKKILSIITALFMIFSVMQVNIAYAEDDTTPPAFASGYPIAGNMQSIGSRQVRVVINSQEPAYHHFVLLPNNAATPSALQVKEGKDADGQLALGSMSSGSTKYTSIDTGTFAPLHNTDYDIYVVLRDDAGNLSDPAKVDVTSPLAAQYFAVDFPVVGTVQPNGSKQVQVNVKVTGTEKQGKVYWVLLPDGAAAPTIDEIGEGKGSGGATPVSSGSPEFANDTASAFLVTGAADATDYDLYMVVGDTRSASPLASCTNVYHMDVATPAASASKSFEIGVNQYTTLTEALAAVTSGQAIKLLQNINTVENIVIDNKTITFDLNSFDLNILSSQSEGLKVTDGTVNVIGSGQFNVTGKLYGVWTNNATVTVDSAESSNDGIGVYAIGGAKVTVRGNVTGQNNGVYASDLNTTVIVNGNVTSDGQIQGAVYSLSQATVLVKGNVSNAMGYGVHTSNGGMITAEGDVYGMRAGAMAEGVGGDITVKGDLSSYNHCAVITNGSSGSIVAEGTVTPKSSANYVTINNTSLAKAAGTTDPEKPGYLKYSVIGSSGVFWVKDSSNVISVSNAAELKAALGSVVSGGTIRLTANIDYYEKILIEGKTVTLNVGAFTLNVIVNDPGTSFNGLEVKDAGSLALVRTTGAFNISITGSNTSAGVMVRLNSSATVNNVLVNVTSNPSSSSAFGVYASDNGAQITVLGNVEVTGPDGGCGAKTWGSGQIQIDGFITAPIYINLNSTYLAKSAGVVDSGYRRYESESAPGVIRVKIAPPVCEIVGGTQYDNLPEALAAALNGQTVKLLRDIDYHAGVKLVGKSVTFDLDGFTLNINNPAENGIGLEVANGGSVSLSGAGILNVSGKRYGVNVASNGGKSTATVTNATATGTGGEAAYAYNKAELTVLGNVTASGISGIGAHALDTALITIKGDVTATDQGIYASRATIKVKGNVVANGTDLIGNAAGIGVGVYDGIVEIGGNVTANRVGAMMRAGGTITIDGTLTAPAYIQFNDDAATTIEGYVVPTTKEGYRTYKTGSNTVWIKDASAATYALAISGSYAAPSGAGSYAAGTNVPIHAGSRSDYKFSGWTSANGGIFANATSASTTFTMPANAVSITANWTYIGKEGTGGSSSGGKGIKTEPVTGTASAAAAVDGNGNASVSLTDRNIADALKSAHDEAARKGVKAGEITTVINVTTDGNDANSVSVNLPESVLQQVANNKISNLALAIEKPEITISLNLSALAEIRSQAKADVRLTVTRINSAALSDAARIAIGNRPAFDLSITSGGKAISAFGGGAVSLAIPYTLSGDEIAENLCGVYVDDSGKVIWLTKSEYDAKEKVLRFTTDHFSVFGIGYEADTPKFSDVKKHWAKADIEFVAARGLLSGTGADLFSPDRPMTRGMFVTALGRLAGIDAKVYKNTRFSDVKADAYYAPYVAWAAEKSIVSGMSAVAFAPDKAISRQEMAAIMTNYAKAMGYALPKTREAENFVDSGAIASWAKDAVKAIQMAEVMNGRNGNRFDPAVAATRAEVSAMLHRYLELVIDKKGI